MKKALKITGKVFLGSLILLVLFLTAVKIWNEIAMKHEADLLSDNLGQYVEIDGGKMNVYSEGEGEHTIVFMSGWGTTSPVYDFRPLYSKLTDEYRIVVIEKFGYGFSDEISGERDFDTILRQDREALQKLDIQAPYVLCPHSLSGLEAQLWAQEYPDEVEAIVGLDMSSANYDGLAEIKEGFLQKTMIKLNKAVRFTGINRFLLSISDLDDMSDREAKQYIALECKNIANDTVCRENDAIGGVCDKINSMPMPKTPTLQFISIQGGDLEKWRSTHQELADASDLGRVSELDCGHYVHQFESERIAKEMKEFIAELDK